MEKLNKLANQKKLVLVGFLQAMGVVCYCALISVILYFGDKIGVVIPMYLRICLVLVLLVFSAAVTGFLVFGYSCFLALQKKYQEAIHILFYTLMFCLAIVAGIMVVMFLL